MRILAVETSCDETAIAVADFFGPKLKPEIAVLANVVSSQTKLHAEFGGVVPNLAKREHQKNLVPVLLAALKEAGFLRRKNMQVASGRLLLACSLKKFLNREPELLERFKKRIVPLGSPPVDAVAATCGPGLAPTLWVGINFAKALARLWRKPLIPANHMAGHFFSAFLQKSGKEDFKSRISRSELQVPSFKFPVLGLLASGGHTELALVKKPWKFKVIGETLDDAAGEAFDKAARILGLGYPGGPAISDEAERNRRLPITDCRIKLPRPMLNSKDFNFSFSGLKTAVLYLVRELGREKTKKLRPLIAEEFQNAATDVLVKKTVRAAKEFGVKTAILGGGVAANRFLRQKLGETLRKELPETAFFLPSLELTGDNALMIAAAAYFSGKKKAPNEVGADANLKF